LIIKIERSGGISGVAITKEIDTKSLPSSLVNTARKIMLNRKNPLLSKKSIPRGGSDYYVYKISIQDGPHQIVLECNEFNIQDDLKSIIRYMEKN
jgi:hypothetical protein